MERDKLNKHIDSILNRLNEESGWELERLYEEITGKDYVETYDDFVKIESILKAENLAELRSSGLYYITTKGIDIVNSGGYCNYKTEEISRKELQNQKELLEILFFTLIAPFMKWNKKIRRQTIWVAWIALVLSFVSIILTIMDKF